ncbi:MAG TPA: winged helix-turn-helix domain-containing protein [Steroidobacteraceae bacterium]|nr:winged helix-turn-helix domain-containing protein [Steroidobacteraceae bacterium]
MPETAAKIQYEFNDFRLDPQQRLLLAGAEGRPIPLPPKQFDTLLYFVERRGELLDKTTLLKAIWPNIVVEENSLNQNISALRRVLGEAPGEHRFIVTEPGRGYRFVADVRTVTVPASTPRAAVAAALSPTAPALNSTVSKRSSIAVLPFANLTGDPAKEYFSDGMAEELIHTLARLPGLRVPARTSSFAYKGRNIDVRQIAHDLQVNAVLEGSVRSAGERVRVTAQLIDAESGYHLWSQNYDRKFDDLFELQDALATEIVRALRSSLGGDLSGALPHAPPTRDIEAYHLYLRSLELADNPIANVPRAAQDLQRAIDRDPHFARAHSSLTTLRAIALVVGVNVPGSLADAEKHALQALALDPTQGATYQALGVIYAAQGRWLEAQEKFDIALARDDTDPQLHQAYGLHMAGSVGLVSRFLEAALQAQRLAPAWITSLFTIGVAYSILGRTEESRRFMELALDLGLARNAGPVPDVLSLFSMRAGRYEEAAELMIAGTPPQFRTGNGDDTVRSVFAGMAEPARRSAALERLNRLCADLPVRDAPDFIRRRFVVWYSCLGGLSEAFELLSMSLDFFAKSGTIGTAWAFIWMPEMLPLRQDPRFQDFARKLRLFEYWEVHGPPDACELRNGRLICH